MANNGKAPPKAATAPTDGWVFLVGGRTVTAEAGFKRLTRGDNDVPADELGLVEFAEGDVTGPGAWPAFTWESLVANDAVAPIVTPDPVPPSPEALPGHEHDGAGPDVEA